MSKCRISGEELDPLFSLGDLYVSNFIEPQEKSKDFIKGNLTLAKGKRSGLVQLTESTDFDTMYRNYWYNSGTNQSMTNQLSDIVENIKRRVQLDPGSSWLDIGCNDGTLLSFVPSDMWKVGCDPSNSTRKAIDRVNVLIPDYFSYESCQGEGKFQVITAIAMFYDLEDPAQFLKNIYQSLERDGLLVIQMSYLPLMLQQMAFDNICHEHLTYYSLTVLNRLLEAHGFTVVDCEINDTNGGSFRVYAQKKDALPQSFGTAPFRDVANFRVESILHYESRLDLEFGITYSNFMFQIQELKEDLIDLLTDLKRKGKTIWGYGASTKGNTLLQYFGLDHTMIDAIADRQTIKWGLKTVGTEIPIHSERDMHTANPDFLLILPWHFVYEFTQREKEFLDSGGKFIVPCPKLEIISR